MEAGRNILEKQLMGIKKILFHINDMSRGGAQRVLSIIIRKLVADGLDIVLVTLWTADNEYELPSGVKRIDVRKEIGDKGRLGNIIFRHTELRKLIKRESPDLVVAFGEKACFRAAVSMQGIKIPLIVSVRNNPHISFAKNPLMTRLMEKKASGCVFQTKMAKEFFSKRLQDKSVIILNPLDEKYLNADISNSSPTESIRIVTAGRIVKEKNHMLLVRAFGDIADKYPGAILQIYGSLDDKQIVGSISEYAKEKGLEKRIELKGINNNLENELQGASMFVLSSDSEGMPNALMEAMALGIPVISTDCPCGGPDMLIEDEVNGLLVPVGDEYTLAKAMSRIIDDKKLAKRLSDEGLKIRERARGDMIISQWKAYFDEVFEKAK